jgi:hypothetical protein
MQFQLNVRPDDCLLHRHEPRQRRWAGGPVMTPGHPSEIRMNRQAAQATPAAICSRRGTCSAVKTGVAANVCQTQNPESAKRKDG